MKTRIGKLIRTLHLSFEMCEDDIKFEQEDQDDFESVLMILRDHVEKQLEKNTNVMIPFVE